MEYPTPNDQDYGYFYPPGMVEDVYWDMDASQQQKLPDEGAILDQDENMTTDLRTYHWLRMIAEGLLDKDERAQARIRERSAR
jgi:hypothetical protein